MCFKWYIWKNIASVLLIQIWKINLSHVKTKMYHFALDSVFLKRFIYLKEQQRVRDCPSTSNVTPQMATRTSTGPGWSQQPTTPSWLPHEWLVRVLGSSSAFSHAFNRELDWTSTLKMCWHHKGLTHCTTTPAIHIHFNDCIAAHHLLHQMLSFGGWYQIFTINNEEVNISGSVYLNSR